MVQSKIDESINPLKKSIADDPFQLSKRMLNIEEILTPKKVKQINDPALHEYPEKELKMRIFADDKDTYEFNVSRPCWTDGKSAWYLSYPLVKWVYYAYASGGRSASLMEGSCTVADYPSLKKFVEAIFATESVTRIQAENAFKFKLTKSAADTWEDVLPRIEKAILSLFEDVKDPNPVEAEADTEAS